MVLTLYAAVGSVPCHQVFLTVKLLNLDVEVKILDVMNKKGNMTPEYLKLNPQHTVPTLVDGEFSLWESRAISRYLVNKYGAGTKLYPQEPQARALVDQRLDFDLGTLYPRFAEYFYPQFIAGTPPEEAKLKRLEEALGFLNTFLEGNKYVAGQDMTIADASLVASISTVDIVGISLKDFPNIQRWFSLMKTAPGYQDAIQKNIELFNSIIKQYGELVKAGKA